MSRLAPLALLVVAVLPLHGAGTVTVVTQGGDGVPVADAVAALRPVGSPAAVQPPLEPVAIVQKDQEFAPYVAAIVLGTRIVFPERDEPGHRIRRTPDGGGSEYP